MRRQRTIAELSARGPVVWVADEFLKITDPPRRAVYVDIKTAASEPRPAVLVLLTGHDAVNVQVGDVLEAAGSRGRD